MCSRKSQIKFSFDRRFSPVVYLLVRLGSFNHSDDFLLLPISFATTCTEKNTAHGMFVCATPHYFFLVSVQHNYYYFCQRKYSFTAMQMRLTISTGIENDPSTKNNIFHPFIHTNYSFVQAKRKYWLLP